MKKLLFLFLLLPACSMVSFAQSETKTDKKEIEKSIDEALREAAEAIRSIEIPDIDFKEIAKQIENAIPSKEEMQEIKESVEIAIETVEQLDLSFIDEILREVEEAMEDIDIKIKTKKEDSKKNENIPSIARVWPMIPPVSSENLAQLVPNW